MKRTLLILTCLAALLSPAAAQATGTPKPPQNPPQTCPCCVQNTQRIDTIMNTLNEWGPRITNLENRVANLENVVVNLRNYIDAVNLNVSVTINRLEAISCQSDRVYEFRLRREVDGSPVATVLEVRVAGTTERGSFARNGEGRFVITADYRGITAPRLQFRTVMVRVRLENGRELDLVQYVRLCNPDDGEPNSTPAQGRAGD